MVRKGSRSGKAAAAADTPVPEPTLSDVRAQLWHALPCVQAQLQQLTNSAEGDGAAAVAEEAAHRDAAVAAVRVPWQEMRQLVTCVYMCTHGNATEDDVTHAVAAVVGGDDDDTAPRQTTYTQADVYAFLDDAVVRWLLTSSDDDAEAAEGGSGSGSAVASARSLLLHSDKAVKAVNEEIIACITSDDVPSVLLPPQEVLLLSSRALPSLRPATLRNPLAEFVLRAAATTTTTEEEQQQQSDVSAASQYVHEANVYDVLWTALTAEQRQRRTQSSSSSDSNNAAASVTFATAADRELVVTATSDAAGDDNNNSNNSSNNNSSSTTRQRSATHELSLSAFRVFVTWLYTLHFIDVSPARAAAVADVLWCTCADLTGSVSRASFVYACEHMCACCAQRHDTATYLTLLVQATQRAHAERANSSNNSNSSSNKDEEGVLHSLAFFALDDVAVARAAALATDAAAAAATAAAEAVVTTSLRRRQRRRGGGGNASASPPLPQLQLRRPLPADAAALYAPEELPPWRREAVLHSELWLRGNSNRLVVCGDDAAATTRVAAALATRLNCVHLDMLELALQTLHDDADTSATAQQLREVVARAMRVCSSDNNNTSDKDGDDDDVYIPMRVQAALLRRALSDVTIRQRGYVLADTLTPQCTHCLATTTTTTGSGDGGTDDSARDAAAVSAHSAACVLRDARNAVIDAAGVSSCAVPTAIVQMTHTTGALRRACAAAATAQRTRQRTAAYAEWRRAHNAAAASSSSAAATATTGTAQGDDSTANKDEPSTMTTAAAARQRGADDADAQQEQQQQRDSDDAAVELQQLRAAYERCCVHMLLERGRHMAYCTAAAQRSEQPQQQQHDEDDTTLSAAQQGAAAALLQLPCMRRVTAAAVAQQRVLSADAVSSPADVTAYVMTTLQLRPCALAQPLRAEDATAEAQLPATVAGDEARAQLYEAAAAALTTASTAAGVHAPRPSPTWRRYCPVTLYEEGVLIEGSACYGCVYRGCVYMTASAGKLRRFCSTPSRYLRHAPADRRGVLLLHLVDEDGKGTQPARNNSNNSNNNDTRTDVRHAAVTAQLAEQLQLLPVTLSVYAAAAAQHRTQLRAREAVAVARQSHDVAARAARDERAALRAKQLSKRKRTGADKSGGTQQSQPSQPSRVGSATASRTRPRVASVVTVKTPLEVQQEAEAAAAAAAADNRTHVGSSSGGGGAVEVTRLEHVIARSIAEQRRALRHSVPVLVTAVLHGSNSSNNDTRTSAVPVLATADGSVAGESVPSLLRRLRTEGYMPAHVLVLDHRRRHRNNKDDDGGEAASRDDDVAVDDAEQHNDTENNDDDDDDGDDDDAIVACLRQAVEHDGGASAHDEQQQQQQLLRGRVRRSSSQQQQHATSAAAAAAAAVSFVHVHTTHKCTCDVLHELLLCISPGVAAVEDGVVDDDADADEFAAQYHVEYSSDDDDADDDDDVDEGGDAYDGARDGARAAPPLPLLTREQRFLQQFGLCSHYCPVTLHEQGLLVRGQYDVCARYGDALYVFASPACRRRFVRQPRLYLSPSALAAPRRLPPRVWLAGPHAVGKHTLAVGLQQHLLHASLLPLYTTDTATPPPPPPWCVQPLPVFHYARAFFERVVAAACTRDGGGGGVVDGITIPYQLDNNNSSSDGRAQWHLRRAKHLLDTLRTFAEEQQTRLAQRSAAEATLAARERRAAAREAAAADGRERSSDDEDEDEDDDDEAEARLREQLEFEPEDVEDAQQRLSDAYLRIASHVTRIEPFASRGYCMICPPFSDGDLEVLYSEGCVPEVVVHMHADADTLEERSRRKAAAAAAAAAAAHRPDKDRLAAAAAAATAAAREAARARRAARVQRRRERALRRWRRRHIGVDDPPSASDDDDNDEKGEGTSASAAAQLHDSDGDDSDRHVDRVAEAEAIDEFVAGVQQRRTDVVVVPAQYEASVVQRAACELLARHLRDRVSLFTVARVLSCGAAARLCAHGVVDASCFVDDDVVALYEARCHGSLPSSMGRWQPDKTTLLQPEADDDDASNDDNDNDDNDQKVSEGGNDTDTTTHRHDDKEEDEAALEEWSEYASEDLEVMRERAARLRRRAARATATRTALVAGRVYCFVDDDHLRRFCRNPLLYMEQPPPPPRLPAQPCLVVYEDNDEQRTDGDDGATDEQQQPRRRRTFGESLAYSTRRVVVSTPKLLSWAMQQPRLCTETTLVARVAAAVLQPPQQQPQHAVSRGGHVGHVDAQLLQTLLCLRLSCADVKLAGAVLINLPRSVAQYEALLRCTEGGVCAPVAGAVRVVAAAASAPSRSHYTRVLARMAQHAPLLLSSPPSSSSPSSLSAAMLSCEASLAAVVRLTNALCAHARDAVLRAHAGYVVVVHDEDDDDDGGKGAAATAAATVDSHTTAAAAALACSAVGGMHTYACVRRHLSEYGWYCPYAWTEKQELHYMAARDGYAREHTATQYNNNNNNNSSSNDNNDSGCAAATTAQPFLPRWLAMYGGRYYAFSSRAYLRRFVQHPCEAADAATLQPPPAADLPRHLCPACLPPPPARRAAAAAAVSAGEHTNSAEDDDDEYIADEDTDDLDVELEGCCPVLLYDTRRRRGLRDVCEPVARRGRRSCVVRYAGRLYALRDEAAMTRFVQQPSQYVAGAVLPPPRKRPLCRRGVTAATAATATTATDDGAATAHVAASRRSLTHEVYVRRELYDAVAHALLAVGVVRPRYPGLSAEQSACCFVSLYMKAHDEAADDVTRAQYRANYELFVRRATLYRCIGAGKKAMTTATATAATAADGDGKDNSDDDDHDHRVTAALDASLTALLRAQPSSREAMCDEYESMLYSNSRVDDLMRLRLSTGTSM